MTTWLETLSQQGVLLNESNQLASVPAATGNTRVIPLLHYGLLSVTGPDAEKFLQGQLTCDVSEAVTAGSRLAAHCNIKGHMNTLFRLISVDDQFWLRCNEELLEDTLNGLKKYIIFSKAEIAVSSDNLVGLGLTGKGATSLVERLGGQVPSEASGRYHHENLTIIRISKDCFEAWLPESDAIKQLPSLLEDAPLGDRNDWQLALIQAGVAELSQNQVAEFIPQMLNLQALDGVSFTKGCYTGQEIITRLQHRGILKRPMYRARINTQNAPQSGDNLHTASRANAGVIVNVASCGDNEYELLAVAVKEKVDQEPLLQDREQGPELTILDLPYTIDPALFEAKR